MKKFIRIHFSNGEVYDVPAEIIAKERTNYYAIEVDGYEENSPEWKEEYDWTMNSEYELVDYMSNNMNWSDIKDKVILIENESKFDYYHDFVNAEKEVVEHN